MSPLMSQEKGKAMFRQIAVRQTTVRLTILLGALLLAPALAVGAESPGFDAASIEFFEAKIRPLLVDNCYTCHSANTNSKGGLRVDDRNGLVHGGDRGAAIIPGKPEESLLLRAVAHTDEDLKMPPGKQLTPEQVADLTRWVQEGAAWPEAEATYELGVENPEYESLRKNHWAWQPLAETATPQVQDAAWPLSDVDTFLLAKLEQQNLKPAAAADRLTLIRRATFDLTGLPPTIEEIDAFLSDNSPDTLAKVVDRLLASPAFGERWGRHWLDVARYGESTGSSRNVPYPHAWRYRDYVIDAVNADKPYDQFIREQIAGDLLPAENQQQRDQQRIATGFLALGVKDVNQRFKVRFTMDNIDEQIDTVSRSLLALTASCARCHDHKFDPIPTSDYYALAGIFHSTDLCAGVRNKMGGGGLDYYDTAMILKIGSETESFQPDAETAKKIDAAKEAFTKAREEFQAFRGKPEGNEPGADGRPKRAIAREKMKKLNIELLALSDPTAGGGRAAFGVRESSEIADTQIRLRGEAEQLGPVVQRGFLGVLNIPDVPAISPGQSGRLQLADWLTSTHNPLTPRVMVNRVWHHLFGAGLVTSVDNFGLNGDVPSHPELLDHLSRRFVNDGWSVKKLIRSLMLSRAYQLGSEGVAANLAADPANRLVWRHNPRRLTAEELRDAALAAAGKLDLSRPEASAAKDFQVVELRNNGPEASKLAEFSLVSTHRSVYLPLLRGITPRSLDVFDFADQGMVTGDRDATTVATQALYLLNDPFVRRQALALAEDVLSHGASDDRERVNLAFRRALARPATAQEIERALAYLADYQAGATEQLALASPGAELSAVPAGPGPSTGDASEVATEEVPAAKKPPANPDEIDQTDAPASEEVVEASTPQAAAWASFCQALFASAEFRFLQ
jgi:hypothetical protein